MMHSKTQHGSDTIRFLFRFSISFVILSKADTLFDCIWANICIKYRRWTRPTAAVPFSVVFSLYPLYPGISFCDKLLFLYWYIYGSSSHSACFVLTRCLTEFPHLPVTSRGFFPARGFTARFLNTPHGDKKIYRSACPRGRRLFIKPPRRWEIFRAQGPTTEAQRSKSTNHPSASVIIGSRWTRNIMTHQYLRGRHGKIQSK